MTEGPAAALVAEDIYKSFGGLEVLKGISLTANEGDVIALIGSSGSGKSTFLRCINMLEIPDKGRVFVSGEMIEMTKNRRRQTVPKSLKQVDRIRTKLAMVFQQFNLWSHMTILENVIEAPVHVLKRPKK
ncbi:MAG: ATP-binding cassette domain-containing protein, partial [Desulfonatronovibrionaceae bacterium]